MSWNHISEYCSVYWPFPVLCGNTFSRALRELIRRCWNALYWYSRDFVGHFKWHRRPSNVLQNQWKPRKNDMTDFLDFTVSVDGLTPDGVSTSADVGMSISVCIRNWHLKGWRFSNNTRRNPCGSVAWNYWYPKWHHYVKSRHNCTSQTSG